jgi:hypothetical protein
MKERNMKKKMRDGKEPWKKIAGNIEGNEIREVN